MTNAVKKLLHDASRACDAIELFTIGLNFDAYQYSLLLQSAVERQFEIIGEALNRAADLDEGLVAQVPELRQIVGLWNRLIHGYDSVDHEIVWDIVQTKLPALRLNLHALIGDHHP